MFFNSNCKIVSDPDSELRKIWADEHKAPENQFSELIVLVLMVALFLKDIWFVTTENPANQRLAGFESSP